MLSVKFFGFFNAIFLSFFVLLIPPLSPIQTRICHPTASRKRDHKKQNKLHCWLLSPKTEGMAKQNKTKITFR